MAEHLEALKGNRLAEYGTHLVVGPMYHTGPLSGMRLLVAGISSIIRGRFDAEATLAAIDKYRYAKSIDAEVADDANKRIGNYNSSLPLREEGFQRSVNPGDKVQVGCGIGETVTVRFQ